MIHYNAIQSKSNIKTKIKGKFTSDIALPVKVVKNSNSIMLVKENTVIYLKQVFEESVYFSD
jgi:hypothetical protein